MAYDHVRPTTNNSATATWDRVGSSAFNALTTTATPRCPLPAPCASCAGCGWTGAASRSTAHRLRGSTAGIGGRPSWHCPRAPRPKSMPASRPASASSWRRPPATARAWRRRHPVAPGRGQPEHRYRHLQGGAAATGGRPCTDVAAGTGQPAVGALHLPDQREPQQRHQQRRHRSGAKFELALGDPASR